MPEETKKQNGNTAQQATAAGGSAINTSLFIQEKFPINFSFLNFLWRFENFSKNSMQLKKLMSLKVCARGKQVNAKTRCDKWDQQTARYRKVSLS